MLERELAGAAAFRRARQLVADAIGRASDARVRDVSMTVRGRVALDLVRAEGSRVFGQAFAGIEDREIETMLGLLRRLFIGLDAPALPLTGSNDPSIVRKAAPIRVEAD